MVLENILEFMKKQRVLSLATLVLTLSTTTPSFALLNGDGVAINDGKESYSCIYKGHRLYARCDYDGSGQRHCLPYELFDLSGKKISMGSLNPTECLILLDPNTDTCTDIKDSCKGGPNYSCC